ncbi:putative disease resistance protein RGA1 [Sesamum angolense]|uniref:Disease resistance protein RGA1 n=1 Tax=Sesamum angolense TaxID=2727404 RepID=A0AAE1WKG6_9LAMI|nr:putative disease resistance protein RGA1 [Sesamum angolense]
MSNTRLSSTSIADAIVSIALQRLAYVVQKQIQEEVNLVRGVKREVDSLSSKLNTIRNVLEDAERRRYEDKTIQNWLNKLEDVSNDIADVLDEWNYAILKHQIERSSKHEVCQFTPSSCFCLNKVATRRDIAKKIKELNERLDVVVKEKGEYDLIVNQPVDHQESARGRSTSLVDVLDIHGRENDKEVLVGKLMLEVVGQQLQVGRPQVISVVGVGGIGKTTLAQLVYNDDRLLNCFELKIWVCVSDVFDEVRIAKAILESVKKESSNLNELELLLNCLKESISGKKYLLVLDDVWTEDYTKWEPLKNSLNCGGPGSKILVTTRSERVARMMGTTNELEEAEVELFSHLFLSYNELSPAMKRCFSYCSVFSKDSVINVEKLIRMWMALGYLNSSGSTSDLELRRGKEYFNNLRMRSFFQDIVEGGNGVRYKMHDIVHDFARFLRNTRSEDLGGRSETSKDDSFQAYGPLLVSQGKVYRSLFCPKELPCELPDFATCTRVLSLCKSGLQDTPRGMEKLIHLRYLDLSHNGALTAQVPLTICRLYDLETLDLYCCGLKEIPSEIGNLINLRYFDLSRNVLTTQLPRTIFHLHNLQTLNLSRCGLKEIPMEIGNLINSRDLELRRNKLTENVPQTIGQLHNLQTLRLKGCELTEIPMEIGNLIHLRHQDLSFNKWLYKLPETICNLHDLRTFNLSYCDDLQQFPEGIGRLVNLRNLLNHGTKVLCKIPKGFKKLIGLQTLHVLIHDEKDVSEARKAKLTNKIHIQKLKILFNDGTGRTDELLRNGALEALQPPPNLRELEISDYKGTKFQAGSG